MALTSITSGATASTDKGIFTGVATSVSIFYTVPEGKKFTGNAFIPPNGHITVGDTNYSTPANVTGVVFPLTLLAGQSVKGYQMTINGVESDA